MSAIAGFFQLDGSPADPKLLENMLARMAYRGPDGSGMHVEGPIALGHLALHITPESIAERQPMAFPRLGLVISADARLDNRDELLDALEVSGLERNMPDSEIIIGAYGKWGADCPARLLGDFVFVIWDRRKRELFCARDQFGARQLYYHLSPQRFVFASEIKSVLLVPGVPRRIDELKLACRLGWVPACPERTLYEGIVHLLPACTLTLGQSIAPRFRRYWELVMEPELRLASPRDYAEVLRELVFAAVRARLRCAYPVAATLSGGLDSSAVACIAARELATRGQELLAVSGVVKGRHPAPERDEQHFMQSVVDQEPNIKIEWALGRQFSPINFDEEDLDRFDEPSDDPFSFRNRELSQIASSRSARILLFGMGGDMAASCNGRGWLEQLARKGRWLELTRQLNSQARIRRLRAKSILKNEVLRPVSPQWLRNLHDRRRLGLRPLWWETAINPDFAARMRLDLLQNELGLATDPPQDLRLVCKEDLNRGCEFANFAGTYFPTLQAAHPLYDRRIWEFCYRVPLEQFVLGGMPRSLFRRSMSEVLPTPIRNRTSPKGWFAPDFRARVLDQKEQVSGFLQRYRNHNLVWQYVHRPSIEDWWRRTEAGWIAGHWNVGTQKVVTNGLQMAHFLIWFAGA